VATLIANALDSRLTGTTDDGGAHGNETLLSRGSLH
jgi:hypothetical protein